MQFTESLSVSDDRWQDLSLGTAGSGAAEIYNLSWLTKASTVVSGSQLYTDPDLGFLLSLCGLQICHRNFLFNIDQMWQYFTEMSACE